MPDNTQSVSEPRGPWVLPRDLDSIDFWRAVSLYLIHKTTDTGFAIIRIDELCAKWSADVLASPVSELMVLRNVQRVEAPPSPQLEEMPAAGGIQ